MDWLQSKIAPGPGPEWDAFIDTLPGYRQAWQELALEALLFGDFDNP